MIQLIGKLATDNVCEFAVNICIIDESQSIYIFYPIDTILQLFHNMAALYFKEAADSSLIDLKIMFLQLGKEIYSTLVLQCHFMKDVLTIQIFNHCHLIKLVNWH